MLQYATQSQKTGGISSLLTISQFSYGCGHGGNGGGERWTVGGGRWRGGGAVCAECCYCAGIRNGRPMTIDKRKGSLCLIPVQSWKQASTDWLRYIRRMMLSHSQTVPNLTAATTPTSPTSAPSPRTGFGATNTKHHASHHGLARSNNGKHKKLAPLEGWALWFLCWTGDWTNYFCLDRTDTGANLTHHPTMGTVKTITHKRDLLEALRKSNPASVNAAPSIFWDVEGSLKTVSAISIRTIAIN